MLPALHLECPPRGASNVDTAETRRRLLVAISSLLVFGLALEGVLRLDHERKTLDLLPRLRSVDPATLRAAPDDPWHPNADGHDWLARELAEWLGPLLERSG